ncbi:unnamed protein product [Meloidogyne enterolobii]|uniref:Uncharacterized protein n=1 Tax=Meloidogyne enterolobii TaxID=390850 RepID=A0ACB0YII5_MELEN
MKKDNLVSKNCESRRKMHADKLAEFMINKNNALEEDKLEDSIKKTTSDYFKFKKFLFQNYSCGSV